MEFPELGTHCAVRSCSQLDFLPFQCDACHQVFCKDHKTYDQHSCTEAYTKDARVPVCPLCNQPVPVNRGEDPNVKVNQHIQQDCQSDKAKKTYTNRCSFPGCRKKELVRVTCSTCHKNYCLKHRFETDHTCEGHPNRLGTRPTGAANRTAPSKGSGASSSRSRKPQATTMTQIGADLNRERLLRQQQRQQPHTPVSSTAASSTSPRAMTARTKPAAAQAKHMSEDEALAWAIASSIDDETPRAKPHPPPSRARDPKPQSSTAAAFDEDEALAKAIAESLNEEQPKPKPKTPSSSQGRRNKEGTSDCSIS